MQNDRTKDELILFTGLWAGKLKDGRTYLAGKISPTCRMVVLPNKYKTKGSNEPDYKVFYANTNAEQAKSGKRMGMERDIPGDIDADIEEDDDFDIDGIDVT